MRAAVTVLLLAALLAPAAGCDWLRKTALQKDNGTQTHGGPIADVTPGQLVKYLNDQAGHLNTVRYNDLSIEVSMGRERNSLQSSTLICAKPRNFLLVGGRPVIGDLLYIGSNDREFWMLTKRPLTEQYLYCSHADFERGAGQLPIPFDPEWALQALGMATYDPNLPYKVDTDQKNRVYTLSWDSTTPQGTPVRREIVLDPTRDDRRPNVRQHRIRDAAGKLLGLADIREVVTVPVGGAYVKVPTRVVLEWPQQQTKMELRLGRPRVNEKITDADAAGMFTRPQPSRGVSPINLAEARLTPR
ncbi:MAG TPA: hypothetical protein VFG68_13515 [Fimbriiglobus sp.]|nr:hypothetical protein [Fimbriiglobus sp.]